VVHDAAAQFGIVAQAVQIRSWAPVQATDAYVPGPQAVQAGQAFALR
jgi:hypothetical protein